MEVNRVTHLLIAERLHKHLATLGSECRSNQSLQPTSDIYLHFAELPRICAAVPGDDILRTQVKITSMMNKSWLLQHRPETSQDWSPPVLGKQNRHCSKELQV